MVQLPFSGEELWPLVSPWPPPTPFVPVMAATEIETTTFQSTTTFILDSTSALGFFLPFMSRTGDLNFLSASLNVHAQIRWGGGGGGQKKKNKKTNQNKQKKIVKGK
jgi:hypothetical protein